MITKDKIFREVLVIFIFSLYKISDIIDIISLFYLKKNKKSYKQTIKQLKLESITTMPSQFWNRFFILGTTNNHTLQAFSGNYFFLKY